jgi:hypothetical protein
LASDVRAWVQGGLLAGLALLMLPGAAPGVTFTNPAPISFSQMPGQPTPWSTYPSTIAVSGLDGTVSNLTVSLIGYRRFDPDDDDMLLVGPGGQSVIFLSDAGSLGSSPDLHTLTFEDAAPTAAPDDAPMAGLARYKVSNYGDLHDSFLPLAPSTVTSAPTLGAAFNGTNPNGTWRLFMMSDSTFGLGPRTGALEGGWQLDIDVASGGPGPDPGPAPPTLPDARPQLSSLRLTPARFRATGPGRVGTRISYTLSESANVAFKLERLLAGRRRGRKCVAPGRARRPSRRCTRVRLLRGGLTHQGSAGANSLRFAGRLRGRALPAGRYRLRGRATDSANQTSELARAAFRIVRR